ncbi:hypothetical protein GQ53DRAFT_836249 [Thozetella sp. PMI_491]|nr:hypothetical protein GQ53DRAFT_836249 [Thozetella sp. PMI_491]
MRATIALFEIAVGLFLWDGALASCGWYLNANDCICMNSVDGHLMADETSFCCQQMGLRASNNKCAVDEDTRQIYKDCCKWLQETSVIGHCR